DSANILAIYRDGQSVDSIQAGDTASIILDRTPFYAESGGQVGDQGLLQSGETIFTVLDTKKSGQAHLHLGKLSSGTLKIGENVHAQVDAERRAATVLNHTATHLLHMVLRQILGTHVIQKGSL